MALFQRQELRQSQSLVMTPQLQQAIKLLQLSSLELTAYVEEQLEQNPLLERAEGDEGSGESGPSAADGAAMPEAKEPIDTADAVSRENEIAERAADLDTDYDNVWDRDGPSGSSGDGAAWGQGGSFDDHTFSLEQVVGDSISLHEHLNRQIALDIADPVDRLIAAQLADMLDEAGYFIGETAQVAGQLGCDRTRVESVLGRLQHLDPPGIFARSLAECLALQLLDRNRLDPAMQALLDNLPLLARRDFATLRTVCGVDAQDLAEMVAELKCLDPKPALAFEAAPVQTVVPDIMMRLHPDGGWLVELNGDALPRVLVNARYYARVRLGAKSREDRDYVAEQYHAANWLVKSLHQRATTVLKVASEIVRQQDGFFEHGVAHLRPLTLRDIAESIDMHESTVSRVTTNKYIATPRGLFELKYFFTSAIASANGGAAHSAEAVRFRIKVLIDAERPAEILSDDKIVDMLRSAGIDIARRTVAKYREAMRIPPSAQRRREKIAELQSAEGGLD